MQTFQEEMSSSAGIVAVKASFMAALDFFLAASKQNNIVAMQVVGRDLVESFYHPAFDDITVLHAVRLETLTEMARTLSKRFNESQSFLSRDHIVILQNALEAAQREAHLERIRSRHTLRNAWAYGSLVYSGGEGAFRLFKLIKGAVATRRLKSGDRGALAELREEVGHMETTPPETPPVRRQELKESCKKICIRTLKIFGGFAKGAVKFSGRAAVGGIPFGIPFFFFLKPEERHALSDKIVEQLLKPALESYKRSISRGEK